MNLFSTAELKTLRDLTAQVRPDTGVVSRPSGSGSLNDSTGVWTPAVEVEVYSGSLRVSAPAGEGTESVFGDVEITERSQVLTVPHDAPIVKIGDRVSITTSDDADLVGRSFRVRAVATVSLLVARRALIEAVD